MNYMEKYGPLMPTILLYDVDGEYCTRILDDVELNNLTNVTEQVQRLQLALSNIHTLAQWSTKNPDSTLEEILKITQEALSDDY